VTITSEKETFKKTDYLISLVICVLFFYGLILFVSFLIELILNLGQFPKQSIINIFLALAIFTNIFISYFFRRWGQNKARKDLKKPINDTNNPDYKIFEWLYSLPTWIKKPLVFIRRIYGISISHATITTYLVIKEWLYICDHHELSPSENHDAIILMVYYPYLKTGMAGFGLNLLINFFIQNQRPYKVYLCDTRKNFLSIINNPRVKRIWIFGHGNRGGVSCSDGDCIYEDLVKRIAPDSKQKEAVYQFHCNPGNSVSLAELLDVKQGFVNHSVNDMWSIRAYLEEILQKNRINEFILLN
jgi:hypothetical protein